MVGTPKRRGPRTERDFRRRELSQNFLRPSAADLFVSHLTHLDREVMLVEVGAGSGVLTERLASTFSQVVAYEIDPEVATTLGARVSRHSNVTIVVSDFTAAPPPSARFNLVGNVPFSRTADIVRWCLDASNIQSATLITQLEYARKRTGAYGRWSKLTITMWPEWDWRLLDKVPSRGFRPEPRVDGGILLLERRPRPLLDSTLMKRYRSLVDLGFLGVGGSLHSSLRRRFPRPVVDRAFRSAGVELTRVVGYVTPDEWLRIVQGLG